MSRSDRALTALARGAIATPWQVLGWALVVAIAVGGAAVSRGGDLSDMIRVSGSESDAALQFAIDEMPYRLAVDATVVLVADHGRIDDPVNARRVKALVGKMRRMHRVGQVPPAFGPGTVSKDGRAALLSVLYKAEPDETDLARLTTAARGVDGIRGEVGGTLPEVASDPDAGSEMVGVLFALVILLVVFGSVVAAGLPLLIAIAALGVGSAGIFLLAAVADVSSMAPQLAATIGLGVGIDYALLILTRYRAERSAGAPRDDAIETAVRTAGHSVAVAGAIVVVSILGLVVTGVELLFMMGVATAICVAATLAASLTVLPALLALFGNRLDPPEIRRTRRRGGDTPEATELAPEAAGGGGPWESIARWAMARRIGVVIGITALLLLIGAPTLAMRVGYNDASAAPRHTTQRQAYDLITSHFGEGFNTNFTAYVNVVIGRPELRGANADRIAEAIRTTPGVAFTPGVDFGYGGEQATVSFFTTTGPQAPETARTLRHVRERVASAAKEAKIAAYVGGGTAIRIDFAQRVSARLPWLVAAVVLVSMLLLFAAFRSVVIPLKAAAMNLLSVGAAYGAVVAVFQWGWGSRVFGIDEAVPIDAYVPVFLFAILFGLSMDYEVFLLSAIRERRDAGADDPTAVAQGIGSTARVITSAAAVMVAVFASFLFGGDAVVRMFGVGLTTAIVVDVTLVRLLLLPATMALLGHWNWWPGRR